MTPRIPRRLLRPRFLSAVLAAALLATLAVQPAGARSTSPGRLRFAKTILRGAGGEPNVSISPDGRTVLVDGLGGSAQGSNQPATLWRSTNRGRTYRRIRPVFPQTGGGDFDMRWVNAHTVIAADLSVGTGIYVDRSTDRGLHWTQTTIDEDVYDRPWLGVYRNHVYVVTKGFDGVPYTYLSTDGGRTFSSQPVPVYGTGVVPAEGGGTTPTPPDVITSDLNAYVDHAAIDPRTGDLYVLFGIDSAETVSQTNPVGVPDRLYIARLVQGSAGPQFEVHPIYLGGPRDGFLDGFNWLTIDRRGTLYAIGNGLHAGRHTLWLSFSRDHGAHWSKLTDVGRRGGDNVYGAVSAGTPGTLAAVYLHGTKADPNLEQRWYVEMERITRANTRRPRVRRTRPVRAPIHTKDICMSGILCGAPGFGNDRNLLDYIWDAIAPNGRAFAVVASDGPATGGHDVDVIVLRQTGGRRFGRGVPS